jgi:hypothetical protein
MGERGWLRRRLSRVRSSTRAAYITPPPGGAGFGEHWSLRSAEHVAALREAGADVVVLPIGSDRSVRAVDFVTGPQLNHLLEADVGRASLFSRIGRPASTLWDDPLGALALSLVWERGTRMGWRLDDLGEDVLERFRAFMAAPGTQHFGWDSGHIDAVVELGLAPRESIEWYPISTYSWFLEQGRRGPVEPMFDVSFCGNVYESLLAESNYAQEPFFVELTDRIVGRKLADLSASSWDLLRKELAALPASTRRERGLEPDRSPFWDYYLYSVWFALTSRVRMELMGRIGRTVDVFGVFADPASQELLGRRSNLRFGGNLHHSKELPGVFAATKVNVCICNGLIYRGLPSKLIDCLASGGFALVDPKPDLVRLFGTEVEAIFFRDADELNAKIEYFLARPSERREIVETLRRVVEAEQAPPAIARRIIDRRQGAA